MNNTSDNFSNTVEEYRRLIGKELEQALLHDGEYTVTQAMRYSTLGGGKRIRGILTLEFCKVFGGKIKSALCSAAAIEMIHAFSLIHDDLPCMDDDDFRRGKPSCHKKYGEDIALLAGDALQTAAFNTAAAAAFLPKPYGIKPINTVSIISTLSNATMEMIKGQQLDMDYERLGSREKTKSKINEEDLLAMYNRKTCALISAACVCGAKSADASDKNIHLARSYGVALGLAFQLRDDLLDIDTEKKGKKTIPLLIGEKKTKEKITEYTDTAIKIADNLPKGEFLKELAENLTNREN